MRQMNRLLLGCTIVAVALVFHAAASHAGTLLFPKAERLGPPADSKRWIEVLGLTQVPSRPVRVLGVIRIESPGPSSISENAGPEFWARLFQKPARTLGADAVIGMRTVRYEGEPRLVTTGLAVQYSDSSSDSGADVILAIGSPRITVPLSEEERTELAASLQARAAVSLERKGWYVVMFGGDLPLETAVGQEVPMLGGRIQAQLTLALDTVGVVVDPPSKRSIVSDPANGIRYRTRMLAQFARVNGAPSWQSVVESKDYTAGDFAFATLGIFRTYAGLRYRELDQLLAEVPPPRH